MKSEDFSASSSVGHWKENFTFHFVTFLLILFLLSVTKHSFPSIFTILFYTIVYENSVWRFSSLNHLAISYLLSFKKRGRMKHT